MTADGDVNDDDEEDEEDEGDEEDEDDASANDKSFRITKAIWCKTIII